MTGKYDGGAPMRPVLSKGKRKALARKRRAEEKAWASKSGPVTTRWVDPATLRPPDPPG